MMYRTKVAATITGLLLTASTALAANALPTVTTFTVPTSAVSPIPVTAFTATDSDGTVTGYMITESSTKPSATASGWSATSPTSYTTTKTGSVTLYAWAKDNAASVSSAKTASTTLLAKHTHNQSDVIGLSASLDAKADISALATKADASALTAGLAIKADATALSSKADVSALADKSDISHNHDAVYMKKYSKVAVVALSGGDYTDPAAALSDYATWCGLNYEPNSAPHWWTPVSDQMCLVKIMPGVYNLGANRMSMQHHIDVEGSGSGVTRIIGGVDYFSIFDTELRNLSIESDTNGILLGTSGRNTIKNVNVTVSGSPAIGIRFDNPVDSLSIIDSNISANQGIVSYGNLWVTNMFITNTKITSNGGAAINADMNQNIYVTRSEVLAGDGDYAMVECSQSYVVRLFKDSIIKGIIYDNMLGRGMVNTPYKFVNSQVIGGIIPTGAKCIGVYDVDYNPVTCN